MLLAEKFYAKVIQQIVKYATCIFIVHITI